VAAADLAARWLRAQRTRIESGPTEYDHTPGYYAVFFYDPDGIKLELLHRPTYWEWLRGLPDDSSPHYLNTCSYELNSVLCLILLNTRPPLGRSRRTRLLSSRRR
jgi:hypothetical protein